MDDELEELRKKRLRELQQQQEAFSGEELEQQEAQQKEIEEKRKQILRAILTTKARERLGNIKVARPDVAEAVENQLILLAQSGRLKNKINDEQLRELLSQILPKKRDIKIRRR
jgi:programmed cell death protein 5